MACLAASLCTDPSGRTAGTFTALTAAGSQLLMVAVGLCFVTAASAYRRDRRVPRIRVPLVVALAAWFTLAALAWGSPVVFVSGYALTAIALALAAIAHAAILLEVRMLGAGVVAAALTITAATNVWMMLSPMARGGPALSDAFFVELAVYLVTALGMQLMTFEDMTEELEAANSQLKAAQIELRHMVVTDPLTGLHNRRFFEEIIAHELNLHRRYGTPLSLVFLDIDRFKSINDTLGHDAGDNTLREVAAFLTNGCMPTSAPYDCRCWRRSNTSARLASDRAGTSPAADAIGLPPRPTMSRLRRDRRRLESAPAPRGIRTAVRPTRARISNRTGD
jgi:hypothetical protein